jgi:lipoprotein-releasing system permease protein
MLARRYLNPRRSMLSSFTLVSLIGVMLGVLVLVVVMAVYAGLERDVKGRLLGFTPHILLMPPPASPFAAMEVAPADPAAKESEADPPVSPSRPAPPDWREIAARAQALPGVKAASAYVQDVVLANYQSHRRPLHFSAIDSTDPEQVRGIERMLDLEGHPESSADLGLDDRVVVSSLVANAFQMRVGDTLRLYSSRNFDEVMNAYEGAEEAPVRERFAADWNRLKGELHAAWREENEAVWRIAIPTLQAVYEGFDAILADTLREAEKGLLTAILDAMGDEAVERDAADADYLVPGEVRQRIEDGLRALDELDVERLKAEAFEEIKQIVLPKEALVIGIYQATQMAMTPELFVSLPLAQSLAGMDDQVQGVSLRLEDPYLADRLKASQGGLFEDWGMVTWGEMWRAFFTLISQQRVMMYFALSFIVLVSAFSMMAVMFTVTIQKRREIGVMKALGAAPGQIVRVFLYQGMILGVAGAILGVGLGRLVIHFRGHLQSALRHFGFDPFSADLTMSSVLPAHNSWVEQSLFALMAFVLCSLAALVPAFFAARSDAARSLRNL